MFEGVLTLDRDALKPMRAAGGVVAMLLGIAILGFFGEAVVVVIGALFVTASGLGGDFSHRWRPMLRFTVLGSLVGALAYVSYSNALLAALVLGGASYLGLIVAAAGKGAARAGLFFTLWTLIAVMSGDGDLTGWQVMAGFAGGGLLAIGMTWLRLRLFPGDTTDDEADLGAPMTSTEFWRLVGGAIGTSLGWFSLARAIAVVGGVVLGYWLVPDFPLWAAITVIVVVRPSSSSSLSVALERTLGTALGVVIAIGVASVLPQSDIATALAFVGAAFLMLMFNHANYTLFAAALSAALVFGQRLVQADAASAGWDRLEATFLGAILAVAVIALTERLGVLDTGVDNG